ncbi:MAG TPA: caspase family protein, partial [Dehalococcoidia bacterium]|nr:caspase family protein [Dehalococcoidia bacterium]
MAQKFALVIGNSEYDDPKLARLITPGRDVDAFARVLQDPSIGQFDEVIPIVNQTTSTVFREIASFFVDKRPDDLLLLYFSGHGVRNEDGDLYLAVKDTDSRFPHATAIPARFITNEMDRGRSRRQILILDCCHSGAFAPGMKGAPGGSVGTASTFQGTGTGRVVLTATDSTEYAWEGDRITGEPENSVFTRHLVQGLQTGEADLGGDGWITVNELYDYAFARTVEETPKQTPGKWSYKEQGEIVLAKSPIVRPVSLPDELRVALTSSLVSIREGAVPELARLLSGSHPGLALAARKALIDLAEDDSRRVSRAATEALEAADAQAPVTLGQEQVVADRQPGQAVDQERGHRPAPTPPPDERRNRVTPAATGPASQRATRPPDG